jgi:hypothetical protein
MIISNFLINDAKLFTQFVRGDLFIYVDHLLSLNEKL